MDSILLTNFPQWMDSIPLTNSPQWMDSIPLINSPQWMNSIPLTNSPRVDKRHDYLKLTITGIMICMRILAARVAQRLFLVLVGNIIG